MFGRGLLTFKSVTVCPNLEASTVADSLGVAFGPAALKVLRCICHADVTSVLDPYLAGLLIHLAAQRFSRQNTGAIDAD